MLLKYYNLKTKKEIIQKLSEHVILNSTKMKEYYALNKIDMLSNIGRKLQEEIETLNGKIKALKWVLNLE